MRISYDEEKRQKTLVERGVDFADCKYIFENKTLNFEDKRFDYSETRYITVGFLNKRMFIVVWTYRDDTKRIISMRKANGREQLEYSEEFKARGLWFGF